MAESIRPDSKALDNLLVTDSKYLRTCTKLRAERQLKVNDSTRIYFFSDEDSLRLSDLVARRDYFIRHRYEKDFYYQRSKELKNKTVVEIRRPGEPDEIADSLDEYANLVENIAILSTGLAGTKQDLLRNLGIGERQESEIDFIVGPGFKRLKSRLQPATTIKGICIDRKLSKRFFRCGFDTLYKFCISGEQIADRVRNSLDWLYESRTEPNSLASVVKTSIALESLLIFDVSEPVARLLSERIAFLLSSSPSIRKEISSVIKKFYNVRSGIVHGIGKKRKAFRPSLLESVDRLALLIYLVISANSAIWTSANDLREWLENERWEMPTRLETGYPLSYLNSALALGKK